MEQDRARKDAETIERLLTELENEIERLEALLGERPRKAPLQANPSQKIPHVA